MPSPHQKQNDWILTTKLNSPLIRSDIVERPHLLARLERDVRRPLTLISAPAGYGKSTLAAQWLEASSLPEVWISLDEADNNPRTFLSYVVAAVRRLESKACARLGKWLDSLPPGVENAHPHLLMSRAYLFLHSMRRVAEIPALLAKLVTLEGESPSDPMLAGEMNFFRGIPELRMGELEASKRHFMAALRTLPETNEEVSSLSRMYSYVILHLEDHRELALEGLRAAIQRDGPRSLHYKGRLVFGLIYVHALAGHWPA